MYRPIDKVKDKAEVLHRSRHA